MKLRNYIRSLLQGEHTIIMQSSYILLLRLILLLYFIYGVLFSISGPFPLSVFAFIFLILTYINIELFNTNRAVLCFILTHLELLSYSFLCTFYLKQDYGFSLYSISMIPMIYFVSSSLKKSEKEVLNPIPLTVLSCLFYISCKAFQFLSPVGYFVNAPVLTVVLYCFNSVIPMIIIIQVCKVFSKVSKNRQAILEIENTQLDYYANQDPLTNLQNRRYFESKLKTSVEKANSESYQFSMLMCDLDDFKKINDTYGHIIGDQVLKNVSQIIQTNIRDFDCAARWGGEEFIILIKGGIPIASLIADRINKAVAASSISIENDEVHYTITIGIAEYSKDLTCSKLIEKADSNLYIGKRTGKNCVIC